MSDEDVFMEAVKPEHRVNVLAQVRRSYSYGGALGDNDLPKAKIVNLSVPVNPMLQRKLPNRVEYVTVIPDNPEISR
jgi:hypothetical protein